jgi:tRNA(Ile)-lysidine synthase
MEHFCLLLDTIRRSFLEAGEPCSLLMGISGGGDSIALLIALHALSNEQPVRLHAIHVNHGLRADADDDEMYVRRICEEYHIPLTVRHVKVSQEGSLESAAREARYTAFSQVADENMTEMLVLAHHADDQAETVLMHIFRGAGSAGAGGMNVCKRGIWRPFLNLRKDFLLACLVEKEVVWREDLTNNDPAFFRNSIRINVMPVIDRVAPPAVKNICRFAEIIRAEEDYFRNYSNAWLKENANCQPPCMFLRTAPLLTEHIAAQRHILRVFCSVVPDFLTFEQTERLMDCLTGKNGGRVNLPCGYHCMKTRDRLHLIPPEQETGLPVNWEFDTLPFSDDLGDGIRRQAFDADALTGAELRTRLPGDRIVPLGVQGTQTLKQYMINHHIDQPFRAHWPCLAKGNIILWVIGVGVSQTGAISESTKNKTMMCYKGRLPDEIMQRGI